MSLSLDSFDEIETVTNTYPLGSPGMPVTVIGAMRLGLFIGRHPSSEITVEGSESSTVQVEGGQSLIGYTDRGTAIQSGSTIVIPQLPVRSQRNLPTITIRIPGTEDQDVTVSGDRDLVRMRIRDVLVDIDGQTKTLNPRGAIGVSSIAMSGVRSFTIELSASSCFAHAEMQLQIWPSSELDLGEPDLTHWEVT